MSDKQEALLKITAIFEDVDNKLKEAAEIAKEHNLHVSWNPPGTEFSANLDNHGNWDSWMPSS